MSSVVDFPQSGRLSGLLLNLISQERAQGFRERDRRLADERSLIQTAIQSDVSLKDLRALLPETPAAVLDAFTALQKQLKKREEQTGRVGQLETLAGLEGAPTGPTAARVEPGVASAIGSEFSALLGQAGREGGQERVAEVQTEALGALARGGTAKAATLEQERRESKRSLDRAISVARFRLKQTGDDPLQRALRTEDLRRKVRSRKMAEQGFVESGGFIFNMRKEGRVLQLEETEIDKLNRDVDSEVQRILKSPLRSVTAKVIERETQRLRKKLGRAPTDAEVFDSLIEQGFSP